MLKASLPYQKGSVAEFSNKNPTHLVNFHLKNRCLLVQEACSVQRIVSPETRQAPRLERLIPFLRDKLVQDT